MGISRVRVVLILSVAAAAAAGGACLLALGLPLLARQALTPPVFAAVVISVVCVVLTVGSALLLRVVARPVDRILRAAARLGAEPGRGRLPLLGEAGGLGLPRAAVAFERVTGELSEERARLAAKVEELTAANRALAEARESLLRSEKLATVGRLAAGLAHEVGNPLGAVSGYAALARSRLQAGADPEIGGALDRIEQAAERIDRTVRDLLDFARPSTPALVPIDLAAAVDASLRLARVQTRFKHVEVDLDLPEVLPRVLADENRLSQVLLNLLLNAGDAMGGRGRVMVAARAGPAAPRERVVLTVADEGRGIAAADLPRVFDPFFTTKEPGEGTGLGLAICHGIMESFGGSISAANRQGGGAEFLLELRAAPAPGTSSGAC